MKKRLIVGLSGTSGVIYGIRTLLHLQAMEDVETHLVMSEGARVTVQIETHDGMAHYRLPDIMTSEPGSIAGGETEPPEGWSAKALSTGFEFMMPHFSRWELVDGDEREDGEANQILEPIEEEECVPI